MTCHNNTIWYYWLKFSQCSYLIQLVIFNPFNINFLPIRKIFVNSYSSAAFLMCVANHFLWPHVIQCSHIKKIYLAFLRLTSFLSQNNKSHTLRDGYAVLLCVLTATAINAHKIFLFFYYDYIHVKWISFLSFPLMLHTKKIFLWLLVLLALRSWQKGMFFYSSIFSIQQHKVFFGSSKENITHMPIEAGK